MFERGNSVAEAARKLVEANGWKARQLVTDQVADAIRVGDLTRAKEWDAIGCEVDLALGQRSDPTTIEGSRPARPRLSG